MDTEYLRDPTWAAIIAAALTAGYIYGKAKLNNEGELPTSSYAKPAALVAILVYFIINFGVAQRDEIQLGGFPGSKA